MEGEMIAKTNLRILVSFCFFMLMIALIIGCAAKKPFWGDEKTGFILNYRLAPNEVWKYQSASSQMMNMEQMGQAIETETNSINHYTIKGKGVDEQKNFLATVFIDTMNIIAKGMGRENKPDLSPFIGKSFGLTFSSKGKELELPGADSLTIDFGMMGGGKQDVKTFFRSILPDLPRNPVKIGETWTEEDTIKVKQGGMDININMKSTHTLEAMETVDGMECLKITTTSKGTLDGEGQQMGMDLNFEGDLEGKATWYFAYKKRLFMKSNTENFMEGTIAASGPTNMTMPITQETKAEVKLVVPAPPSFK
jgi:hypothetical protein